ncbi:MAG: hypothetical protein KC656_01915, partial [Myxococcales bacterium]|nr:hypothetical protein [Myxococcales bacterium]
MSDVEAIQPVQELELFENPWLQERRELQLTTRQTIDRHGLGPGELGAELGLSRVLQVGLALGATSAELEVGLGLLHGRAG